MIRLILTSLRYHWRTGAAVAAGVAVAVAVLTGALVVGDSMRGSLRDLALDRLGRIDCVLAADRFFDQSLADRLAASEGFHDDFDLAVPVILARCSLTNPADPERPVRANRVNLIGCDARFWELDRVGCVLARTERSTPSRDREGAVVRLESHHRSLTVAARFPAGRRIVLNRPLAEQLGVGVGDAVVVRLAPSGAIPAESLLGRRAAPAGMRLTVGAVVEAKGLGAFGLNASQQSPRNAYVAIDTLQERLNQPGRANAILVAGRQGTKPPSREAEERLQAMLRPRLADYGLRAVRSPRGYVTLSTDRLLFSRSDESAIRRALGRENTRAIQPALTYLANTIARGEKTIPYSTITAVDFAAARPLGPMLDVQGKPLGPLVDDEIVLNAWAADDLGAKPGDSIRVTYFEPESMHGRLRERTASFRLAAVVPVENEIGGRDLLPNVPGVTDQLTMDDWDPPFPFDAGRIRPKDERYWDQYRGTPKAFVSLAIGRRLWASRFGQTTTIRVADSLGGPRSVVTENQHQRQPMPTDATERVPPGGEDLFGASLPAAEMGFAFQPVRRQSLAAAAGTTSFNGLFLGFSFFLIVSAVLLVVLLFRLGVELRAAQIGLLLAVGWRPGKVARMLAVEGAVVAVLGSVAGTALGVGYAAIMLLGLETWWLAAIVTPFLRLHVTAVSLIVGATVGCGLSLAVILLSVRRIARGSPSRLMAGPSQESRPTRNPSRDKNPSRDRKGAVAASHSRNRSLTVAARKGWLRDWLARPVVLVLVVLSAAAGLAMAASRLGDEYQAAAFFGVGALVLVGLVAAVGWSLVAGSRREAIRPGRGNLLRLAVRSAGRHPLRSTLSIALVASACFLIVSVSAFRVDPTSRPAELSSGNGGFALVAQSDLPIYADLGTHEGRRELGFSDEDNRRLDGCVVVALRVRTGDDASCLNLYRPRRPRILGVPSAMIARGGFAWAASVDPKNPWRALVFSGHNQDPSRDRKGAVTSHPALNRSLTVAARFEDAARFGNGSASEPAPMILEHDTAVYALHLDGGLGATYSVEDDLGRSVPLAVVGQLKGSPFQGDLLIAEDELLRHWPDVAGYRFFLVACPAEQAASVRAALERTLGDYGLAAEPMADYLAGFLAVPNTYLSTFQSLGGLGLLLGTLGLAVVQLRNVVERRRELAVLRAVGLRSRQIAWLVLAENGFLLIAGLACGVMAAAVAVLPHLLSGDASVPVASLTGTLAIVLLVGLVASALAVRAAVASPLLEALREE